MIDILEKMISYLCIQTPIDFIISLKGGNVLLVDKLISLHKNEIIHITYNRNLFHQSYGVTKSNRNDLWESISLQFENINELIRVSNLNSRKLNGIILDCSFSSGKGILSCVDDFNDLLKIFDSKTPMINSIGQAITIYSHVGENIQEELKRRNCKIDYLFSLDEDIREMLYSQIYLENDQHQRLKNLKKILKELKKRNLINNEYLI